MNAKKLFISQCDHRVPKTFLELIDKASRTMNLGRTQADEDLELRVLSFLFEEPSDSIQDGTSTTTQDFDGIRTQDHEKDFDSLDADFHTPVLDVLNIDAGMKRKSRLFSEEEDLHHDVQSPTQKRKTLAEDDMELPNLEHNAFESHIDVPLASENEFLLSSPITSKPTTSKPRRRRSKSGRVKSSPTKDLRKQALTKTFESLDETVVKARTEVHEIVARKATEIVKKKKRRKHKRGSYVCRLCGLPKKNHKCKFAPKVKTKKIVRVKKYVSIGIQCEMDEEMTIVAMNREVPTFDECMSPSSSSLIHAMEETNLIEDAVAV